MSYLQHFQLWCAALPLIAGIAACHNLAFKGLDQAQLYGAESHPAPDILMPKTGKVFRIEPVPAAAATVSR